LRLEIREEEGGCIQGKVRREVTAVFVYVMVQEYEIV